MVHALKEADKNAMILELRDWVNEKVRNGGVAVTTLAMEAGIHRSQLSSFLNRGSHTPGIVEKLLALRERLERESDLLTAPPEQVKSRNENTFLNLIITEDFQQAVGLCSMCHDDGEIGVIIGHAGSGKTTAMLEFCNDRPDVLMIRGSNTMSIKEMLTTIGTGLGLGPIYGSKERMVRTIILSLKRNPVTLVIDEADQLVDKYSVSRLETLRTIWDHTHIGMILCGMPKLAKYLVKGPGTDENLAQIYSRIRRAYRMRGVNRDEMNQILDKFNITQSARKYLMARGATINQGGLRRFCRLMQNALDLVEENEPITLEIIKEADGLLVTPESLGMGI